MRQSHYETAMRFVGMKEVEGQVHNPMIMAWLTHDNDWPENDETPWCSAFVNWVNWLHRMPRSKSLRARSWLQVGTPIPTDNVHVGDVVILKRGKGNQPGPDVIEAPGHVGYFAGWDFGSDGQYVMLLGGNQSDSVNISRYKAERILGIRRMEEDV